jgi:RimJ/RimL family protein N-acetyltransferase
VTDAPPLTACLEGKIVTLEPLSEDHADGLWEAAQPAEIWAWLTNIGADRGRFEGWMEASLAAAASGTEGPFAIRGGGDGGTLIGSSRYLNVRRWDRVVEIGWTWLTPSVWRTGANVEAKLLMLSHAFETLGCIRVEFKTDSRNERSRAAIAALPAQDEGVMRNHMIVPDIGPRDSAYYSVIDAEWPQVRANLERRLSRAVG